MCERLWRGCHWTLIVFKDPPSSVRSICQWVTDTSLLQEIIFRYKLRTIVSPEMGYFTTGLFFAALISLAVPYSLDDLKGAVLEKLGLKELPNIHKRNLENLVIPAHIKNKYLSMLKLHNKRRRRSLPSLAGILRGISGNADISGEVMYSDTTRQRLVFDMEARIPENSEVTMAELKLFKKAPRKLSIPEKKNHRPVNNARVSIYWLEVLENGSNRTSLVDSRLVPIHETGWKSFDVTQAVHYWSKAQRKAPLHLEVWIEGERPGSYAAELAKSVHFTTQDPTDKTLGKPELVLYTLNLEEFGSRGDCDASKVNSVCCREEYFINFRELTWTQYWIIEPAGYQAFRCAGGCKQPKRNYGYGERSCAAVESAPLPMMYLVKKGDYTEIEVAEFPNMIVEKCGCTMDNISVV
ncbi:left-right determination factor 2-like [Paramormyrops kingsleyae]|uniref:left-right determination factor 2-like n=1 Tax=Paramormyrops kingsleyae TaxID=1676925 RepID=UPI003B97BE64